MARPKGIKDWNPDADTRLLLRQVNAVLEEYRDHLPLTARQVFYRLVGSYGYDKTEQAYARLCNKLVLARRSLMIPFSSIRDDGTVVRGAGGYANPASFLQTVRASAQYFRRHRQAGQPVYIELSCEAGGMVPQMTRVCHDYGIPVYSGGGFNSLTAIKEVADRALGRDVPTVLLHVGDFDPSGVSIFNSLGDDAALFVAQVTDTLRSTGDYEEGFAEKLIERFCPDVDVQAGASLQPVRVALTVDQVDEHDLETAPPKRTDTRSANWPYGFTAQCEALPPDVLADIVRGAIEQQIDMSILHAEMDKERADRTALTEAVDQMLDRFSMLEDDDPFYGEDE